MHKMTARERNGLNSLTEENETIRSVASPVNDGCHDIRPNKRGSPIGDAEQTEEHFVIRRWVRRYSL